MFEGIIETDNWFGPLFTIDLRKIGSGTPLRFHLNANYYIDNSKNLHDFSDVTLYTRAPSRCYAFAPHAERCEEAQPATALRTASGASALARRFTPPSP